MSISTSKFASLFRKSATYDAIRNAKNLGFAQDIAEGLVAEYVRQNATADDLEEVTLQELVQEVLA